MSLNNKFLAQMTKAAFLQLCEVAQELQVDVQKAARILTLPNFSSEHFSKAYYFLTDI